MIRLRSHCAALALFGAAVLSSAGAQAANVVEVRVGEHPDFTRIVFELDQRAGYRVEHKTGAKGPELVVTLEAASGPRKITGRSKVVPVVQVDAAERAVAHIQLRQPELRLQEMILSNPPRIVLDLMREKPALAAAPKPAPETKPAPAPEITPAPAPKPVAETKPAPPKPATEAKVAPSESKPAPTPKPVAETKPAPPKPVAETKPAPPKPATEAKVAPPESKPAPTPKPVAETKPAPAPPKPVAETRPVPPPPPTAATKPPAPTPKPVAETKPEIKPETKPSTPLAEAKPATKPSTPLVAEAKPVEPPKPIAKVPEPPVAPKPMADAKPPVPPVAETKPTPAPPKPVAETKPEIKPETKPLTPLADAKPVVPVVPPVPPLPAAPGAKPAPAPASGQPVASSTPEMEKALMPPAPPPGEPTQIANAQPAPKPAAEKPAEKPAKPEPAKPVRPGMLSNPLVIGAGAGVLACGLLVFFLVRRRRALPNDLDVTAIADERSEADAGAQTSQSDEGFSLFGDETNFGATSTSAEQPAAQPAARMDSPLDSLFDDDDAHGEPVRQGAAKMTQTTTDLPTDRNRGGAGRAPAAGAAAGGDVMRMIQALEARVGQLEGKLDAANEAREKLERQVAAQSEELRVQRAAIARTQRALRTMTRGDEEKATEPALKDSNETTQSKTRINV